ncbi:glycosyltransferase family 4 protein [Plesiomonas shigelloides]
MNILYINHYAGSPSYGMEYRPYYMAKEWVNLGHKVRIVASSFSHVRRTQPVDKSIELIDGIEYQWIKSNSYVSNGFMRVINIFTFLFSFFLIHRKIVNDFKPDVVIASSTYPLDIYIAKLIADRVSAKLVFEVHDLWPLSPIEIGGMSPKHPFIYLCQHAENYAYKNADAVVSMLPKVHTHMQDHGLDLAKLHIIPNGISIHEWDGSSDIPLIDNINDKIIDIRSNGGVVCGYAGSHGKPNALIYLLESAYRLRESNIHFILVGSGLEKDTLLKYKNDMCLDNVHFFEPIPKGMIPSFLSAIDFAYIGAEPNALYRFGIAPNKMMDYMMAQRPILNAIDAGNDPVSDSGCGLTVSSANVEDIVKGIKYLSNLTCSERSDMGSKGRTYILEHHLYSKLASDFVEVMK